MDEWKRGQNEASRSLETPWPKAKILTVPIRQSDNYQFFLRLKTHDGKSVCRENWTASVFLCAVNKTSIMHLKCGGQEGRQRARSRGEKRT